MGRSVARRPRGTPRAPPAVHGAARALSKAPRGHPHYGALGPRGSSSLPGPTRFLGFEIPRVHIFSGCEWGTCLDGFTDDPWLLPIF